MFDIYRRQSRVEIEHCILDWIGLHYHVRSAIAQNFVKGRAQTCCVNVVSIHELTQCIM